MRPLAAGRSGRTTPLWERQVRQWDLLGRPLRPSEQDTDRAQAVIDAQALDRADHRAVLILGVTPELVGCRWPDGTTVLATDSSMAVIQRLGPEARARRARAAQADWLTLPVADASCDLVLSDGGFANVPGADAAALAASVRRVLRPDGVLATRMFLRPDDREDPGEVWDDLLAGRIDTFAAFKLRLLMALSQDDGDVCVAEAWRYFEGRSPDVGALAEHLGWPVDAIRTIEAYRDQPAVYWFPTLARFRAVLARDLDEQACHWPDYELGDRCPTFVFR